MRQMFTRLILTCICAFLLGCSSIEYRDPSEKSTSFQYGYQTNSAISLYFETYGKDPTTDTGFYPLNQGHDAFLARISLIESAQKSLDLQYYIYRGDETSTFLTWRLYEAAKRGVRVRVLLDDMQKRNDSLMAAMNQHPNIEIRLFNPHQYRSARLFELVTNFDLLNRRMHNKALIADSVAAVVGGRNIGNEYFSYESTVSFGDFDLLLYGETVQQTADQFDLFWNSLYAVPMEWVFPDADQVTDTDINSRVHELKLEEKFSKGRYDFTNLELYQEIAKNKLNLYWGKGDIWFDLPDKIATHESQLVGNLSELFDSVEHSFVLISPYFVPTEAGTKALIRAARRGVDITIITNSLASNDVFAVHGWYSKYRKVLLESGIQIWEMKASAKLKSKWSLTGSSKASLHAKAMLIDNKTLFAGSMNWDPRSAKLNTEMAVVIEQPEYVQSFLATLPETLNNTAYHLKLEDNKIIWTDSETGKVYHSEPEAGILRKLGSWFAGILPIEKQL